MIIMCARVYENTTRSKKIVNYNCTTFVTSYDLWLSSYLTCIELLIYVRNKAHILYYKCSTDTVNRGRRLGEDLTLSSSRSIIFSTPLFLKLIFYLLTNKVLGWRRFLEKWSRWRYYGFLILSAPKTAPYHSWQRLYRHRPGWGCPPWCSASRSPTC